MLSGGVYFKQPGDERRGNGAGLKGWVSAAPLIMRWLSFRTVPSVGRSKHCVVSSKWFWTPTGRQEHDLQFEGNEVSLWRVSFTVRGVPAPRLCRLWSVYKVACMTQTVVYVFFCRPVRCIRWCLRLFRCCTRGSRHLPYPSRLRKTFLVGRAECLAMFFARD